MPVILHADMDAFFAAIEQRDRPELAGRAVVVGGLGRRGVVATASYEARRFGVHSAMPTAQARRLCPQGVFLAPRMEAYLEESRRVMAILEHYTDLVEPLSLDEAFLDVTASERLLGDGPTIARRLKDEVRGATGLAVSVGVASSKFVAKVASDLRKPDGLVVVPGGEEAAFLAPLPVERLWGAGRVTAGRLRAAGLSTIGDLQALPVERLVARLGQALGLRLHALCRGSDPRRVEPRQEARSIGRETTFEDDLRDDDACRSVLLRLAEDVGRRLRAEGLRAGTVRLKVRFPPFETHTRQKRLPDPSNEDLDLYRTACSLLDEARPCRRPVRLLGLAAADLREVREGRQAELFGERPGRVEEALDAVRRRFGPAAVRRAGPASGGRAPPPE